MLIDTDRYQLWRLFVIIAGNSGLTAAEERRRKKKSRWGGSDNEKTFIPGMPTVLPSTLSADQQEAYLGKYELLFFDNYRTHAVIRSMRIIIRCKIILGCGKGTTAV